MYELLVCHRRSNRTSRTEFGDHWRRARRRLVEELKPALGHSGYAQLHRASRFNVFYLGILLSRSWPLAALFSLVQGLPVPPLAFGRRGTHDERWDVVERFRYPSRGHLVAAWQSAAGTDALSRLAADAQGWVRHGAVIAAEVLPIVDDPAFGYPRTVTLFCLRSRPPMSREAMLERWRTAHSALVAALRKPLGYRKYDQLHVRDVADASPAGDVAGGAEPFDGIAMLAHASQWDLAKRLLDPRTQLANLRLAKDEVNFIDGSRSALVFGTEYSTDP